MNPEVSAIIPCLDEEETLGLCIEKIWQALERAGVVGEIVVGDNGSTDRSVEIAVSMGARVVHQPIRGYGAAIQAAASAARGRYLVMADADDSYDWGALMAFVEELRGGADLVMGNRFRGGIAPGAMPALHRYLGNPLLSFLTRKLYRLPVGDFHCGMRGFTKTAFKKMASRTTGMEFATEMVIRAKWAGLHIAEIPTTLQKDKRTRAPHLRSFRDGWRHLQLMLTYAPNSLYLLPGLAMLMPGILLSVVLAAGPLPVGSFVLGPHFVALGALLCMLGFNLMALGVLARVIIWRDMPSIEDWMVRQLVATFSLEPILVSGALAMGAGGAFDLYLLWRRFVVQMPMDDTIHAGFAATTALVLGFEAVFFGFLLKLLLDPLMLEEQHRKGPTTEVGQEALDLEGGLDPDDESKLDDSEERGR